MTDSKLAAALRECEWALERHHQECLRTCDTTDVDSGVEMAANLSVSHRIVMEAIARYGEACREAGEKAGRDAMTAAYEQAIPGQQAAARLAGRLEQAKSDLESQVRLPPDMRLKWLEDEITRLRKEAERD